LLKVNIGQSVQSIQIQIKEHNKHITLAQPDKSAVGSHVNAAGFILDKVVDPSKSKSKRTINI